SGIVHTPGMATGPASPLVGPASAVATGTTQRAGAAHGGPFCGSHACPAATGATHVPSLAVVGAHCAPAWHSVVVPLTLPHGPFTAANATAAHESEVSLQYRPSSRLQSADVWCAGSHVAPTVAPCAMHEPVAAPRARTHVSPCAHGWSRP